MKLKQNIFISSSVPNWLIRFTKQLKNDNHIGPKALLCPVHMIKPNKKLKLPSELYSRNTFISLLIEFLIDQNASTNQPTNQKTNWNILQIGGRDEKLAWFIPTNVNLTIADSADPNSISKTNYLQSTPDQIPFPDQHFDLVILTDALLAQSSEKQQKLVLEALRLTSRYLIVAAPFQTIFNQKTAELLNRSNDNLPDLELVEGTISALSTSYLRLGEGNIYNWYFQQLLQNLLGKDNLPLNRFFNENIFSLGNFRLPTHRTVIVADRQKMLPKQEILQMIEGKNNLHSTTYFQAYQTAFQEIKAFLAQSEQQNSSNINQLNSVQDQGKIQHDQIKLLQSQLDEVQAVINEKNQEICQKNQSIENFSQQLSSSNSQLNLFAAQVNSQENFLSKLRQELAENQQKEIDLTKLIVQKEQNIRQKEAELISKNNQLHFTRNQLTEARGQLDKIERSRSWKFFSILTRFLNFFLRPVRRLYRYFRQTFSRRRSSSDHPLALPSKSNLKTFHHEIASLEYQPLFSLLLPLNLSQLSLQEIHQLQNNLEKLFQSLRQQIYTKWELALVINNNSDQIINSRLESFLNQQAQQDNRLQIIYQKTLSHDLASAANLALKSTRGAYFAILTPDLVLSSFCLYELLKSLQILRHDLIYTGHSSSTSQSPVFKPNFDPDLLLSTNYFGQLTLFRRKILEQIGQFKAGLTTTEDLSYDLILRFTDRPRPIYHLDKTLCFSNQTSTSTGAKPLQDTIYRRLLQARIIPHKYGQRLQRNIKLDDQQKFPLVSIVISFRDQVDQLKACVDSIFEKTTYPDYEIILVNNQSELLETIEYMKEVENCPRVRLFHYESPYNFAALSNFAASQAKGEYLLLLSSDVQVLEADWIEALLEHAQRPEIGIVGIQPLHHTLQNFTHRVNSVSASCLMIRKQLYQQSDGLDEENLALALSDLDLCLRLKEKGFIHLYTPFAKLHQLSFFPATLPSQAEENYLQRRHQSVIPNSQNQSIAIPLPLSDSNSK
jgi:glycosyltransferase involved in cell wall biosynthesis